jgi:hypothetical protein
MSFPRCECGETMAIVLPTMDLVCESCGYTQPRGSPKKEKVSVEQEIGKSAIPYRKEVDMVCTVLPVKDPIDGN